MKSTGYGTTPLLFPCFYTVSLLGTFAHHGGEVNFLTADYVVFVAEYKDILLIAFALS